ncbi:Asp23/Gls24 family envelope stress response protein [Weissella minor]|uniref:Stress response regulator gls24 homolog n=1 Tax=Weissella minor TaxID=1620 RepID=A0A0R2JI71_9LACO|nr:Asp23/Gls24 family envelope stress response protein [Weissella minor]KRN77016.1 general stress protein gls20 [Weissella minor]MBS0949104.1 Asp23/Gls24 family envelope stress response protein [Weissella minor]
MATNNGKTTKDTQNTTSTAVNASSSAVTGELTFDDKVIQKIIGISLAKIDGLLSVDGGFFSNLAGKVYDNKDVTTGINTEVGKTQVAVDMEIVVEYGKDINDIYDEMKKLIKEQVKTMTGLDLVELNVKVVDIQDREEFKANQETLTDKVVSGTKQATDAVSDAASSATESVKDAAGKAGDKTKEVADKAGDKTKEAADKAEDAVSEATESRVD